MGLVNAIYNSGVTFINFLAAPPSDEKPKGKSAHLHEKEHYSNLVEDIIIYSEHANDDTELERFNEAVTMVDRYNDHGVKVHLVDFKDLRHAEEKWKEYEKRLCAEIDKIRKERLNMIKKDPELYRKYGRKIAMELYPA